MTLLCMYGHVGEVEEYLGQGHRSNVKVSRPIKFLMGISPSSDASIYQWKGMRNTTEEDVLKAFILISQVILAIAVTWIICAILTVTNVFPDDPDKWGYGASTNIRLDVLDSSPWFRFPYPGRVTLDCSFKL